MVEKIKAVRSPRGLTRLIWRAPIGLYQLGLGGLMGEQYVLLNHIGRISGRPRQAVVEVVHHDQKTGNYIIASGYGEKSDWYQNVMAHPHIKIQVGQKRMSVLAKRLPFEQAKKIMLEYGRHHPTGLRAYANMLGYHTDGSEKDIRLITGLMRLVALTPV